MAKLKEILDAESQRGTLDQCRVIRLYPEGTFLRAYEWSAWLCVRYSCMDRRGGDVRRDRMCPTGITSKDNEH